MENYKQLTLPATASSRACPRPRRDPLAATQKAVPWRKRSEGLNVTYANQHIITMNDACWLPSAIMQTTGALLGIYAVIYALGTQFLAKETEFRIQGRSINTPIAPLIAIILYNFVFYVVVLVGLLTIYFNYLWLDGLIVGLEVPINIWARKLFIGFLYLIGFYTIVLITFYRMPVEKWRGKIFRRK